MTPVTFDPVVPERVPWFHLRGRELVQHFPARAAEAVVAAGSTS